ncbi:hypothetical protein Vadar_032670 [Vaccinium darrowii]|uniref:Uncharacterized protein n=1 Tax=Vaccinium darrowii TaxID=229202 RepID=A0ACB7XVG0_9ERIC|nr:hypothetical protein Vadar_032670 [Vaccinium darrowii]
MARKAEALTLFVLLLSLISVGTFKLVNGQKSWCVAKPSSDSATLLKNINYACSQVDCRVLQKGCLCSSPDNLINHASIAMNLYYQCKGRNKWNCDFKNSGLITVTDPKPKMFLRDAFLLTPTLQLRLSLQRKHVRAFYGDETQDDTGDIDSDMELDDIDYDMEHRIASAIENDDKGSLVSLIRSPSFRWNNKYDCVDEILESICKADAVNCANSLLEGELGPVVDVNMPMLGSGGEVFPLHYAATYACPGVVKSILSRGARTDIRLYDPLGNRHDGLLPLEIALDVARDFLSGQIVYSPGQSLFRLIASLCHPRMKRFLTACKLLAWSSKNVAKEAYSYVSKGKLTEFAVLLMVAREKVLLPITFSRQDGDSWNGSMTIHQLLKYEYWSLFDEGFKPGSHAKRKLTWVYWKKMSVWSTALVLEVFVRAGNAIEEYIQLEHHSEIAYLDRLVFPPSHAQKVQVEKDVALRLVEAGFTVEAGEINFSFENWMNSCDPVSTLMKYQENASESWSQFSHPHFSWLQQRNLQPRNGVTPCDGYWSSQSTYPLQKTHSLFSMKKSIDRNHTPKSTFSSHYSTSLDVQANKQTKPMEQGFSKCLPREKLASISMLIKRRIRSARLL